MSIRKALRLYFYLLARGVVRERELCEALDCTKEELMQLAQVLMDSAIPIRIGEGFWLEDDDVFSLFLHEEEMETLKDFQRLLRETNPKLQRRLADMVLLRAAADDLLRLQGGRASRQNLPLLDEMIEKAVQNNHSLIVHFETDRGEDVKEIRVENILRTDKMTMILSQDLSGQPVNLKLEQIVEAYRPSKIRRERIQVLVCSDALTRIVPFLEEEATIIPRGKDVLLSSRVYCPQDFFDLIREIYPEALLLDGGKNHVD